MSITLSPETVKVAKDILMSGFEGKIKPFDQCFEPSETATANHVLYEHYKARTGCVIPKVFIYIVMEQVFGPANAKDYRGDLGYNLRLADNIEIKPAN